MSGDFKEVVERVRQTLNNCYLGKGNTLCFRPWLLCTFSCSEHLMTKNIHFLSAPGLKQVSFLPKGIFGYDCKGL